MFDNGLNRDTVYYEGLTGEGWATTEHVCLCVNRAGFAITLRQTETLLSSLAAKGKVEKDSVTLASGHQHDIWRKKK
jgi:hypothetical protein